jgi:biotin operon repressor
MSRSARLLQLLDTLRRARQPQTGPELAQALGVSLRTLYRDIATLRTQGADILGDPGIGFEMRPGFLLPPLMFNADELEALLLGARWASLQADPQLAQAATAAMDRIRSALPLELRIAVDTSGLLVPNMQTTRRPSPGRPRCAAPSAPNTRSCCTTGTSMACRASAGSGRLPWPTSSAAAWSRHGASCARPFVTFAPTAWMRWRIWANAIRKGARR